MSCLLNKGAAVNVTSSNGETPLHLSVKAGHVESSQQLLRYGANVLITSQVISLLCGAKLLHYLYINVIIDNVLTLKIVNYQKFDLKSVVL